MDFPALPGGGDGQLLSYSLKPAVQSGSGYPQVFLKADADFRKVTLDCEGDAGSVSLSAGSTKRGKQLTFDLKQPPGEVSWTCEAKGFYGAGDEEYFDLGFRFSAFLGGALAIEVPRDEIDLDAQMLVAIADREVSAAHLTLTTPDGPVFDADVEVGPNEAGEELLLEWTGNPKEVLQLNVTLTDKWGFYSYEDIFPWSLEIPHEDVLFDSGKHEIRAEEQPKIDKAYGDIDKVASRYSKYVEVRLYIAGYTDTVGDRASNQGLSERRARSIAAAFRAKGFSGPVYYQGFGEDSLEVATDDNVDEIRNRRALYVLASRPPAGASFPRGNWKKL